MTNRTSACGEDVLLHCIEEFVEVKCAILSCVLTELRDEVMC